MDFLIETQELQRIIRLLGVTAKVNTPDFRGRVLIEAKEDNTVLFMSNNNSTAISISARKVAVNSPGEITVLYGKMKAFINSVEPWNNTYGTKEFNFVYDGTKVFVLMKSVYEDGKSSNGKLRLKHFRDSLPRPEKFNDAQFILNSNMLKKATSKVIYAIDPNEMRQFIQGMKITFRKDDIYFAGTNGLILSEYQVKNSGELTDGDYVVKYDFLMGLRRALGEETQIFFEIDGRKIKAKFDDVVFSGKLIIGYEYPDYQPLFDGFTRSITVGKKAILNILSSFSDVLDNEDNNRVTFKIENGKMIISNEEANHDCDFGLGYNGVYTIDLNGNFLHQTIDAIDDDEIIIKFTDDNDQGCFIFDSGHFENQKALITPIKRR